MEQFKQLCRDLAENPDVMKWPDIAAAAGNGAAIGARIQQPFIGAIAGVAYEAAKRAVTMSEKMLQQLHAPELAEVSAKPTTPKKQSSPKPRVKPQ